MDLKDLENKTILLLGKSRAFSDEELEAQMRYHKVGISKEYTDYVSLIVEGRLMSPYEQNESDRLYEQKDIAFVSIDELEREVADAIETDTLMMSLKLSHDKERLKDFLTNTAIPDEVFLKLLKLYKWGGEDFFDNDDNRDISAAFIERFYENIERNHNVAYATTGFYHLVNQSDDARLLNEIYTLEPIKHHPRIKQSIALNINTDDALQRRLYKSGDRDILKALARNKRLSLFIIKEFLDDEELAEMMAKNIELDATLFEMLKGYKAALALNQSLSIEMQKTLLELGEYDINYALAHNDFLNESIIKSLFELKDKDIDKALYQNASTPQNILEDAYKYPKFHEALSKNENTPIDILYQLQLDSRYERYVRGNPAFGKHIQTENIGWL